MEKTDQYNPEEEVATEGQWKLVDLPEVEEKSGEENYTELFTSRTKLYRWRKPEWKERGIGNFRIMKHKESTKIIGMLRQEGTKKIMAHFNIVSLAKLCELERLKTSDKTWVWSCFDFSDPESKLEQFCLRFKTKEDFEMFEKVFNESKVHNDALDWGLKKKEEEEEEEKVEEKKVEEKKVEEKVEEKKVEEKKEDKKEEKVEEKKE